MKHRADTPNDNTLFQTNMPFFKLQCLAVQCNLSAQKIQFRCVASNTWKAPTSFYLLAWNLTRVIVGYFVS